MPNDAPPRAFVPRVLSSDDAQELYGHEQIEGDLRFAQACFADLARGEMGVVYSAYPLIFDDRERQRWALFVTGAVWYRRCFSGARSRLSKPALEASLTPSEFALHSKLLHVTDKHVAHSINELELGATTLSVAVEPDGSVKRGGIGSNGLAAAPMTLAEYREVVTLIERVVEDIVKPVIVSKRAAVKAYVDQLSDEELMALPEGFPPNREKLRYEQARQWPRPYARPGRKRTET